MHKKYPNDEPSWCIGRKSLNELILKSHHRLKKVYLTKKGKGLDEVIISLDKLGVPYEEIEEDSFNKLFEGLINLNHQGVCADIAPSKPVQSKALLKSSQVSEGSIIVALDQVQDPQNLGAIFRICDSVGANGLMFPERRNAGITPLVRKVSAGATEFVPYSIVKNLAQTIKEAKKAGYWICGTSLNEKSSNLYEIEIPKPVFVIFGSEGSGLRRQTESLCDFLVHIPQFGKLQSMNVAATSSAILFELKRRDLFK